MYVRSFVATCTSWDELGNITPLSLTLHGRVYPVDRLLEPPRQAHPEQVGGTALRFRVQVLGQVTNLFMDERNRWFVEEKVQPPFDRSISLPKRHL